MERHQVQTIFHMRANIGVTAKIMISLLQDAWEKEEVAMEWKTGYTERRYQRLSKLERKSNFYPSEAKSG